jgi:phospholipid/cholesterol/gamma-HCH transport system substrate-binding protein
MRIIKFNKFERVAGLFIVVAIVGSLLTAISVAVKQGWFETKVYFAANFENADGIHPGTVVQMAGLRAGSVEEVELQGNNRIKVTFFVQKRFQERVKADSTVQLIRPFIIGDRVLDITVGAEGSEKLAENSIINSEETMDLMTLMSGKKMGVYLSKVGQLMENMHEVLLAFADPSRTRSLVRIFDKLDPLVTNLDSMSTEVIKLSRQVTHEDNIQKVLANVVTLTHELNTVLPELNRRNPQLAQDLAVITRNLNTMTTDLKVIGPAFQAVGGELPQAAQRAVEALNEATVLIKAMEKNFFVRGSVKDVREDEAKDPRRTPSSVKNPSSNPVNACEDVK